MDEIKLLLLEDAAMDAELIMMILERSDLKYSLILATNKEEFISALDNNNFDLILSDNSLPAFNATRALQILKEREITTPFILVTGTVSEDFAVAMMKEGASDYILKDRLQRLPNAIRSALQKHNLEIQHRKYFEELSQKEALMKESEKLAHIGSWNSDLVRHTTLWSDENYRILDYAPKETTPSIENFIARVHPDEQESVRKAITDAIGRGDRYKFTCRIVSRSGDIKNVENEIYVTRNEEGVAIRVNGFSKDVTETVNALTALQRSEANLKSIFNNTDTGYLLLDNEFNIISYNKPMNKFSVDEYNMPIEENANAARYFIPEKQDRIIECLNNAVKGVPSYFEIPYPQPDGSNKWYYVTYHPVWQQDTVIGVILSQKDITARKNLELQERKITSDLIQRNSDLEQFTYIVSHNLRGPVATILGISDIIKDDTLPLEEKTFFTDGLVTSVKKLDGVIADLNNIIHSKNTVNEKRQIVQFAEILGNVVSDIQNATGLKPLNVTGDFSEAESILSIKSYIYSIFYNLISNSVKYRQHNVPLKVEVRSRQAYNKIKLFFKDNGMGIDLQKKGDQVFGLYRRFHHGAAEGKGMGLFMVKTQVETLGGRISVESEVNFGTQFTIEFEYADKQH